MLVRALWWRVCRSHTRGLGRKNVPARTSREIVRGRAISRIELGSVR